MNVPVVKLPAFSRVQKFNINKLLRRRLQTLFRGLGADSGIFARRIRYRPAASFVEMVGGTAPGSHNVSEDHGFPFPIT